MSLYSMSGESTRACLQGKQSTTDGLVDTFSSKGADHRSEMSDWQEARFESDDELTMAPIQGSPSPFGARNGMLARISPISTY